MSAIRADLAQPLAADDDPPPVTVRVGSAGDAASAEPAVARTKAHGVIPIH